jgi:L-ornithine N5-oxygenase
MTARNDMREGGMNTIEYDVIGVGFGPANIALAIALEELNPRLAIRFLEKRSHAGWQEGMLFEQSDIQNHPLRDLVTPRNPRSRYSFTNFLFENNRLFEHLNLGLQYPLRIEYAQYVRWVAGFFVHQVDYGVDVVDIEAMVDPAVQTICGYVVHDRRGRRWRARSVVCAPGRTPNIPPSFAQLRDERIVHLNDYLHAFERVCDDVYSPRIAVIGGSQSAVEILLHADGTGLCKSVMGITRNFGFRQKDTSPFSDEVYFPQFVHMFFHANHKTKDRLRTELALTNYSSADKDVVKQLYLKLYLNRILKRESLAVHTNTEVIDIQVSVSDVMLRLRNTVTGEITHSCFDLVVFATGFLDIGNGPKHESYPALLARLEPWLDLDGGHLNVAFDYRVKFSPGHDDDAPLYLNGLCESSHGIGDSGLFSLLSLRSAAIVKALSARLTPCDASSNEAANAPGNLVKEAVR